MVDRRGSPAGFVSYHQPISRIGSIVFRSVRLGSMFRASTVMLVNTSDSAMKRGTSRAECPARKSQLGTAILALFYLLLAPVTPAQQSPPRATLTVKTSVGATVWVSSLRFGKVPESGQLTISNLRPGTHTVRARLNGRHEGAESVALGAGEERTVSIPLSHPADAAEQHFQNAEDLRDTGKQSESIKEYR